MSGLGVAKVNRQPLILSRTLTADYVVFDWIDVKAYSGATFYIDYTPGESAKTLEFKIEFSSQATFGYQQQEEDISGGVVTLVPVTHKHVAVNGAGVADRYPMLIDLEGISYMRVSVREVGVSSTFGTVAADVSFGWE